MVFFIDVLRALAACFITNAHYEGIYPNDIIANGGLIGDVLFFAVSGYCLTNTHGLSFPKWYGKRLLRVYPPVLLITLVYMLAGFYTLEHKTVYWAFIYEHDIFWWFIYPTNYHFITSIVLLYIPYYFVVRYKPLRRNISWVMAGVFAVYLLLYLTVYDKSTYHIDNVYEPIIRFLFFESMLLGAKFKLDCEQMRGRFNWIHLAGAAVCFIAYFASKLLFSHGKLPGSLQILNQIAVFGLLVFMFALFCGLDRKLEKWPRWLKWCASGLASITLEVYLVQKALIRLVRDAGIAFPINWLMCTAIILTAGIALHCAMQALYALPGVVSKYLKGGDRA